MPLSSMVGSTLLWSLVPLVVHFLAPSNGVIAFTCVYLVFAILCLGVMLWLARSWLNDTGSDNAGQLARLTNRHCFDYLRIKHLRGDSLRKPAHSKDADTMAELAVLQVSRPGDWLKAPLVLTTFSSFTFLFFTWSISYVETSVATVILESWPLLMLFLLAGTDRKAEFYKHTIGATEHARLLHLPTAQKALASVAIVGIALVIAGHDLESLMQEAASLSGTTLLGVVLSFAALACTSIGTVGAISYGQVRGFRHVEHWTKERVEFKSNAAYRRQYWYSIQGTLIARVIALGITVILLPFSNDTLSSLDGKAVIGCVLLGVGDAVPNLLHRIANLRASKHPGINIIACMGPVLAIVWLAIFADIDVDRIDLFIIGAALVVVVNIVVQLKPPVT